MLKQENKKKNLIFQHIKNAKKNTERSWIMENPLSENEKQSLAFIIFYYIHGYGRS